MMVVSPYDRHLFRNSVLDNYFRASGDTDKLSFLQWMLGGGTSGDTGKIVDMTGNFYYSHVAQMVWNSRADLQNAFRDPTGARPWRT